MSRIPLGRAYVLASTVIRELRHAGVVDELLLPVGSIRRFAPEVGGVGLLAAVDSTRRARVLKQFTGLPSAQSVEAHTDTAASILTSRGPVTLHVTDPSAAGAALVWFTGSQAHVHAIAAIASRHQLRFGGGRLLTPGGDDVPCASEEEFYARLELPLIAPELRNGDGEIEAARAGQLPPLVTATHIRGDLHMHSTWSDGRDTIEEMVRASIGLGYEYIAITDHSQRAWSSNKLGVADVDVQRAEIVRLRPRYPQIRIFHGVEVDIMPDGALDFEDEILAGFDIVLASLHDHAMQKSAELTRRYLAAIGSRYVDVITHPMNRTPGVSEGYKLDLPRIFEAAAETGTAMEIDGAPGHLDMDGAIAREAAAAGVTLAIDSDCHRAQWLRRQMRFGVGTARRGWIEPRHVLNTRSAEEVVAFVARKRARG
jgi:DNA polymerase (family 10)